MIESFYSCSRVIGKLTKTSLEKLQDFTASFQQKQVESELLNKQIIADLERLDSLLSGEPCKPIKGKGPKPSRI